MNAIDVLSALSVALLAMSLVVLAVNARTAPRLVASDRPSRYPRVSVLIPARDEAVNLPGVLAAWERVDYPDWELVVLDDHSTDETPRLLEAATATNPHLRVLRGRDLPGGWLGKNWACQQLSEAATGELLLFADADVTPSPQALAASVALLEREQADALSGFGHQDTSHWSSRAVVPLVMEIPLAGFLPMRLAVSRPEPSLAAAVGQWFLFRSDAYQRIGGHAAVRGHVVEDVSLATLVKRSGMRLVPALAHDVLRVAMYRDFAELWRGFSKNISNAGGGGLGGFAVVQVPATFAFLLPWLLAPSGQFLSLAALALLVALRLGAAALWRRSPGSVFWHPVGSVLILAIGIRSALSPIWPVAWKGRLPCRTLATPS